VAARRHLPQCRLHPSKALIHAAEAFHHAVEQARVAPLGIKVERPTIDLARTMEWKDGIVGRLTSGVARLLKRHRVKIGAGPRRDDRRQVLPHRDRHRSAGRARRARRPGDRLRGRPRCPACPSAAR
jgi:hypothetical protein